MELKVLGAKVLNSTELFNNARGSTYIVPRFFYELFNNMLKALKILQ
jgi:hypothetical protein